MRFHWRDLGVDYAPTSKSQVNWREQGFALKTPNVERYRDVSSTDLGRHPCRRIKSAFQRFNGT